MADLVLKNGKIVTPDGIVEGDLFIEGGKIIAIGGSQAGGVSAKKELDCTGRYILPGAIDVHVHFREPPPDSPKADWNTESHAAAAGGITTVFDMPNTSPSTTTVEALEEKRAIANAKSVVNFRLYMGLTDDNLEEIKKAPRDIAGVKVYMGASTGDLLVQDLDIIEKLLEFTVQENVPWPVVVHAENEAILRQHAENIRKYGSVDDPAVHSLLRPPLAAYQAVRDILHLAKKHSARVHITHASTAMELEEIEKFKSPRISCDTTPHHLFLGLDKYAILGNFVRVNPPLRGEHDRAAPLGGRQPATRLIDLIATDHAPHTKAEKEKTYLDAPSGIPEVQTMLPLLLDVVSHGQLSLHDVIRLTSSAPARLFNLPSKGSIEVGKDADLVIVDMEKTQELTEEMLLYKCKWSPYTGWHLTGWPVTTIIGGKISFSS